MDDTNQEPLPTPDVDASTLTPLTPWLMRGQATINIGTIGHVAHGKSTVVKALSGVTTVRFKNELERNITIKLGYANAKIFRCQKCPRPECYSSGPSHAPDEVPCSVCSGTSSLERHVSFVDCPGHDVLMATMLGGAAAMDAALLLVSGNEPCPQPQTAEHLAAIEIMRLRHLVVLQNKIDLVSESAAKDQYRQIREFLKGTLAEDAPIIPVSAQLRVGVDVVCEYIATKIPVPLRDFTSEPRMIVIRSFDVNKPGSEVEDLKGGVAGGTLHRGVIRLGDPIELRPGLVTKDADGKCTCKPISTRVETLFAERNQLSIAAPGGLVGVGTRLDSTLSRSDRLVGQLLGRQLPSVYCELELEFHLLRRLLGIRQNDSNKRVQKLSKGEVLMVNVGSLTAGARVVAVKADLAKMALTQPVCTEEGEKLTLSRRIERHWRLIGWGQIRRGVRMKLE